MGWASFFNDIASEMIAPLVPIFLTTVLGAPVAIVGLIEGIADSTSSILRVISGWLSDKFKKRKIFVVVGYSLSTLGKFLLSLAVVWPLVLFARFLDKFGKGTRTSARDALITESSEVENRGRSFGFHRMMDTLGAVFGPILALLLLTIFNNNFRSVFLLAVIPAIAGIIILVLFVKETKNNHSNGLILKKIHWRNLSPSFKIFLIISIIFALGNSSEAFLVLRARSFGLSVILVIFAYTLFNIFYALFSYPAGILSDKIGQRKILFISFLWFGVVYLLFGLINRSFYIWLLFPLYGIFMALNEGVGKAYISNLVPSEQSGTAFGIYQTSIGLCAFFASWWAGLLWVYIGVRAPFVFGSTLALIAAVSFLFLEKTKKLVPSNK